MSDENRGRRMNSFVPVQSFALQPFQMSANRNPIPQSDLVFHYNVYGGMQSGIGKFDPGSAMMLKNQLDSLGFIERKPLFRHRVDYVDCKLP